MKSIPVIPHAGAPGRRSTVASAGSRKARVLLFLGASACMTQWTAAQPLAAAELMVCYATPNTQSMGPIFLQEPLRCAAADKSDDRGRFIDVRRGLAELYESGWKLIQVLERRSGAEGTQYLAYVEKP